MGGLGSGRGSRYSRGSKPIVGQALLRLDVGYLNRRGWLRARWGTSLNWSVNGEQISTINLETGPGDPPSTLFLVYRTRSRGTDEWEDVREPVALEWQPCRYGGTRPWLHCPRCNRRVGVLWGASRFRCRQCHGAVYASQNRGSAERATDQMHKLRDRLGEEDRRPKGMHATTHARLLKRIDEYDARWAEEVIRLFG